MHNCDALYWKHFCYFFVNYRQEPEIINLPAQYFCGLKVSMSFANNQTGDLWSAFMPGRKALRALTNNLYSIEVYPSNFFDHFDPHRDFEKWAAVEVTDGYVCLPSFQKLVAPGGFYAKFRYKGLAANGVEFYNYVFREWLPPSAYMLDHRPHFAIMGEKYRNNDANSEEDILIPVAIR